MRSKRSYEGVIELDQRASSDGLFEWATYTCSHCQKVCKIDPLRKRPSPYCTKCDRYICEDPRCNSACFSVKRWVDMKREEFAKKGIF